MKITVNRGHVLLLIVWLQYVEWPHLSLFCLMKNQGGKEGARASGGGGVRADSVA